MTEKLKAFIIKYKLTFIGVLAGLIGGFLYWKFVGCESGTCMIKSNPINMTLYGGMMGGLVFSMFEKKTKEPAEKV